MFNVHTHVPPKYDLAGYLKPEHKRRCQMELLHQKESIPSEWIHRSNSSGVATRSELLMKRKGESLPDASYDLDGDGVVGGRDLVLARLFDKDNDGKLNETERRAALEGIARGVEGNFMWNVSSLHNDKHRRVKSANVNVNVNSNNKKTAPGAKQPLSRVGNNIQPFRHFIQVRGKVIEAENFQPILDTYPEHPLSQHVPHVNTLSELRQKRKADSLNAITRAVDAWERQHPSSFKEQLPIYDAQQKRLHSSRSEIHLQFHKEARMKCGLLPEETDIGNKTISPPTLAYVCDPKHKTKTDIIHDIKRSNHFCGDPAYQNQQQRLNSREEEIFNKLYTAPTDSDKRRTLSAIRLSRKAEVTKTNALTFNKETHGIHGHDLPKFSQSKTMKEFWKSDEHYCKEPRHNSLVEYKESIKYWKPSEELLLNEHKDEEPQRKDPFKCEYHPIEKNKKYNEMVLKVNNVNHYQGFDPTAKCVFDGVGKNKHICKWTPMVNQFAPNRFKDGRLFDAFAVDEGATKGKKGKDKRKGVDNGNDEKERKDRPCSTKNVFKRGSFFVNVLKEKFKGKINWIRNECEKEELYKSGKNSLYHKFSKEENKKGNIPRGAVARDKGF